MRSSHSFRVLLFGVIVLQLTGIDGAPDKKSQTAKPGKPRTPTFKFFKVQPHLCKLLEEPKAPLRLQAITRDQNNIYLIESDNVYSLNHKLSINVTNDEMYLFKKGKVYKGDPELVDKEKWFNKEDFMISSEKIEKHSRERKGYRERYDKHNSAAQLKSFHLFVTDLENSAYEEKPNGSDYGLIRSYVFYNGEEYLLFKNSQGKEEMLIDSIRDCQEKDDIRLCHRHASFHAVTDGENTRRGFIFYFDISPATAKATGRQPRVLIAPLKGEKEKSCELQSEHREMLNFPNMNNSNPIGAYMRVGIDRSQIELRPYFGEANRNMDKNDDYFFHLPYGLIVFEKVYLFSKAQQRVYIFRWDQFPKFSILEGVINGVKSKSFSEFFICKQKKTSSFNKGNREPTQADYVQKAIRYVEPPPEEQTNWSVTSPMLVVAIVLLSTFIGLLLCIALYQVRRFNKKRRKLTAKDATLNGTENTRSDGTASKSSSKREKSNALKSPSQISKSSVSLSGQSGKSSVKVVRPVSKKIATQKPSKSQSSLKPSGSRSRKYRAIKSAK